MAAILALCSLLASGLPADPVVPPGEDLLGRTVLEVAVEGVEPESALEVLAARGEPLTRGLVRDLIQALWETDRYRDVQVRALPLGDGVRLTVRLDERRRIRTMESEGNDHMDLRELRRVAGFVPDAEEHPDLLAEMRGRIEAAYAERGYPNVQVGFRSEPTGEPGRVVLVTEVVEGEPIRLAAVHLAGTLVFPEPMVRRILEVEAGDPWDQPALAEAAGRLAGFYRSEGYLRAEVPEPAAEPLDADRVSVTFTVTPGLPVRIVFGGNARVSAAQLAEIVGFDEETAFVPADLDEAAEAIATYYHTLGFPDVEVGWDVVEGTASDPAPLTAYEDPAAWSAGLAVVDPFGEMFDGGRPAPQTTQHVWFLRFRVREGLRLRMAGIEWGGAAAFDDDELDEMVFEHVAAAIDRPTVLQPFPPGELAGLGLSGEDRLGPGGQPPLLLDWGPEEIYLESAYRDAGLRIEERYRTEGYLGVEVTVLEPVEDDAGRTITPRFRIVEGPQSILGRLRVAGVEAIDVEDIEDVYRIDEGDPVNELLVEETRRAILELYASRGYLFAEVERQVAFSGDRGVADVTFVIAEGPQVHVRSIEVTGNALTETSLILGSLAFSEGDVFSPDAARESERRLLRMGIFQGVTVAPVEPDVVEAEKTIAVQVREYPPQLLELRAGFSTGEGARAALIYGYRNLFGYAVGLHLRLKLNYQLFFLGNETYEENFQKLSLVDQLERQIVASLSVPYLPGLGGLLSTQLDLANERDNEPFYGIDRSTAYLGLSTGWRKLLSFSLRGGVEYNNVLRFEGDFPACTGDEPPGALCLRPEDARRLRTPQGTSTFGVVRGSATVDWRDDPFNPTRGLYFTANAEWVRSLDPVFDEATGITSFSHLIKTTFGLSGYAPLGAGLVLALSARYGQIFQLQRDSRTFPDRYFYLGGSETLRGFPQESVSVADAPAGIPSPGGDLFLVLRGELRIPLGDTFGAALFSDIGNLWRDPASVDLTTFRYTAGLGLRIQTPIGPLAFDYGVNLDPRDDWGEDFGALHFSIGTF